MLFLQFYEHQEQGGDNHHRDSLPNKIIFSILKTQSCKECKESHRPTDSLSEGFVIRHGKFLTEVDDHQIIQHSTNEAMKPWRLNPAEKWIMKVFHILNTI